MTAVHVTNIIAQARAATGLEDLGDPETLEGLDVLVEASVREGNLSQAGATRWESVLVGHLANRFRLVDYLKQNPTLRDRPIDRPTFVFGFPRRRRAREVDLPRQPGFLADDVPLLAFDMPTRPTVPVACLRGRARGPHHAFPHIPKRDGPGKVFA
jgi:hypothetical protein